MPPNKPQSNFSNRPIRRVRLLKIGPQKAKSLFEEYFYGFLAAICVVVIILGKAGGLSGHDAVVTGLWVGGITWSAWVLRRYRKEQASAGSIEKSRQAVQAPPVIAKPLSPNFKPMIGPQWPMKTMPGAARPKQMPLRSAPESMNPTPKPAPAGQATDAPSNPNKPAFVYERLTWPDRKPKLPNNWPGLQDKKPKR